MLNTPKLLAASLLGLVLGRASYVEAPPRQLEGPRLSYDGAPLAVSHGHVRTISGELVWGVRPKSVVLDLSSIIAPVPGASDSCELHLSFALPRQALTSGRVFVQPTEHVSSEPESLGQIEGRVWMESDSPFCPPVGGLDFQRIVLRVDRMESARLFGHVQGLLAGHQLVIIEESCTNAYVQIEPIPALSFSISLDGVYLD